jgi:hypothetical protein
VIYRARSDPEIGRNELRPYALNLDSLFVSFVLFVAIFPKSTFLLVTVRTFRLLLRKPLSPSENDPGILHASQKADGLP